MPAARHAHGDAVPGRHLEVPWLPGRALLHEAHRHDLRAAGREAEGGGRRQPERRRGRCVEVATTSRQPGVALATVRAAGHVARRSRGPRDTAGRSRSPPPRTHGRSGRRRGSRRDAGSSPWRSRRAMVDVDGSVTNGMPRMFVLAMGSPSRRIFAVASTRGRISPTNSSDCTSWSSADDLHDEEPDDHDGEHRGQRATEPADGHAADVLGGERDRREQEHHDDVGVARGLRIEAGAPQPGQARPIRPRPRRWRARAATVRAGGGPATPAIAVTSTSTIAPGARARGSGR